MPASFYNLRIILGILNYLKNQTEITYYRVYSDESLFHHSTPPSILVSCAHDKQIPRVLL
jgi:hypothetical protein